MAYSRGDGEARDLLIRYYYWVFYAVGDGAESAAENEGNLGLTASEALLNESGGFVYAFDSFVHGYQGVLICDNTFRAS